MVYKWPIRCLFLLTSAVGVMLPLIYIISSHQLNRDSDSSKPEKETERVVPKQQPKETVIPPMDIALALQQIDINRNRISLLIQHAADRLLNSTDGTEPETPSIWEVGFEANNASKTENETWPLSGKMPALRDTERGPSLGQPWNNSHDNNVTATTGLGNLTGESQLDFCVSVPIGVGGNVFVDVQHTHDLDLRDVIEVNSDVQVGGHWKPRDCVARHRLAVIIPYRDRRQHLVVLLAHLLPILKRQLLNFRIYVVEQFGNDTFNKGSIMNAAFKEALKQYDFHCFVFHDVDLIPEDDRNMYSCPVFPRHLSVAIDEMDYRLTYDLLVGGVLNFRTEHFQKANGYSNMYWGWGAEDDDMAYRILNVGLKISRPPQTIARYKMIRHQKRTPTDWKKRALLLKTVARRFRFDGLNSLKYKLIYIKNERLFTHILVDIGKPP